MTERGMSVNALVLGKGAKLSNVTQFMAESREKCRNAVDAGDIGVYDTGTYQLEIRTVGKKQAWVWTPPTFTPEIFMKVSAKNVMQQKKSSTKDWAQARSTPTTKQVNTC